MKHFVGLDVSLAETAICIVDEEGIIVAEGKALSDPGSIHEWLQRAGMPISRVGLEIGGLSRWLCIELKAQGWPAICIDPRRLRGLTKTMPVKTDRKDARAIAQVMRVGWFSIVHIKGRVSQELRMLLANRKMLLTKQIDIENEIRGTLRVFGIKLSGRISQPAFEGQALTLLEDHPRLAEMVRPMLLARSALREQCAALHKMVLRAVNKDDVCLRLMTIPGVGAHTAITYVTTVENPARFQHSRDVSAHLGLTPRKYASGEVDRTGAISKCGDSLCRTTFYQAALTLLTRTQRWSSLKAWGMSMAKLRGLRRAVVAVTRKLAVVMHRVWTDGAEFRWTREEVAAS